MPGKAKLVKMHRRVVSQKIKDIEPDESDHKLSEDTIESNEDVDIEEEAVEKPYHEVEEYLEQDGNSEKEDE